MFPESVEIIEKIKKTENKLSEADKMFIELNYKKHENEEIVWFQKKINEQTFKDIIFDLEKKTINIEISYYDNYGDLLKIEGTLTLEELQAINKKVEELGWNVKNKR